ncbi:MAG: glycosyltransferase family 4 protein [Methanobrevibacter boviskoreani]|jgi:phospho-N-acetylmuramoyl-pentapeptide-transferase|uniref:glycosyltransferase family 4 protein n=1 Tax=Methanobrevibacter boviskoreani TaxID=1348249 RepID=UPI003D91C238
MKTVDIIIMFFITLFSTIFFTWYIRRILLQAKITDSPIVSEHRHKAGTPTMGGIAFLFSILLITAIYYKNNYILITCFIMVAAGIMGLVDDLLGLKISEVQKLVKNVTDEVVPIGLLNLEPGEEARVASDKAKAQVDQLLEEGKVEVIDQIPIKYETGEAEQIFVQLFLGVLLALTCSITTLGGFNLGIWAIPIVVIAVLGAVNTVNLIDGMDGLAAGILAIASFSCIIFGIINGRMEIIPPFAILTAICLGFLVFNKYPASIFMGDTGSILLGAGYAAAVMLCDVPYFGVLALGVPIFSVCVSLAHRAHLIEMAVEPLHHALNYRGIPETTIIYSYWGATVLLCAIGLIVDYLFFI